MEDYPLVHRFLQEAGREVSRKERCREIFRDDPFFID